MYWNFVAIDGVIKNQFWTNSLPSLGILYHNSAQSSCTEVKQTFCYALLFPEQLCERENEAFVTLCSVPTFFSVLLECLLRARPLVGWTLTICKVSSVVLPWLPVWCTLTILLEVPCYVTLHLEVLRVSSLPPSHRTEDDRWVHILPIHNHNAVIQFMP
jgi:hypothetical protein